VNGTANMGGDVMIKTSDRGPQFIVRLGGLVDGIKRIPIAILGKFQKGSQKFAITRQTLADIVANFRKRKADTVIDCEHASEFPELAQGQAIPAAGWITALDDQPDANGVLWGTAKFTPGAARMIAREEYRYISPAIEYNARDKHTGANQGATLLSAALTNRPFLDQMPAIALSEWAGTSQGTHQSKVSALAAIEAEIREKQAAGTGMSYGTAWKLVASERPDLIRAYNDGVREGMVRMQVQGDDKTSAAAELARALVPIETEINLKQASGRRLSYGDAWKEVEREKPELMRAYNEAAQAAGIPVQGDSRETMARSLAEIDEQIRNERQENPKLTYGAAWTLVKQKRPDLMRAYNEAARRVEGKGYTPSERTAPVLAASSQGTARDALAQKLALIDVEIRKKQAATTGMSYGAAWKLVASERPDLMKAYHDAAGAASVLL
jgi:uncharacterized protein YoaH (UPF0181 family)